MNIALLFNAHSYSEEANYWWATRDLVFSNGIIQTSNRHMRLSIGDTHVGLRSGEDPKKIFLASFCRSEWQQLIEDRLISAFESSVIFAMVFDNMPCQMAHQLHSTLCSNFGYIGAISVHFEYGPHLAIYRNSLVRRYRLEGISCRAFYTMGEEDGKDEFDLQEMRKFGYTDLGWEDKGAHRTIFDDFDTLRHFERVANFRKAISNLLPGGDDGAYELVLILEDLNPKLFDALGAAMERITNAETKEEVAQSAISGRRYMEQLADVLFPAIDTKRNGRSLSRDAYKNRLWAFVEENVGADLVQCNRLGREIDRVTAEFNGAIHADRAKNLVLKAFADAAQLTMELLKLSPEKARKPYYAFQDRMKEFFREAFLSNSSK